jgi:hypothetical protein
MGNNNKGEQSQEDDNNDDNVRDRLNSSEFQKISPPSSPTFINNMKKDNEMSYSGILVENPDNITTTSTTPKAAAAAAGTASTFAADLSTPPISNKTKSKTNKASSISNSSSSNRRIVKATPPPSSQAVADENNNDITDAGGVLWTEHVQNVPTKGANAASDLLEESLETSKNKRMERVTNKQKNDREKLLQEKRRVAGGATSTEHKKDNKNQPKANPFSKFLSAFSTEAPNPKHKRKDSTDDVDIHTNKNNNNGNGNGNGKGDVCSDANKRLKFGFNDTRNTKSENDDDAAVVAAAKKKVSDDDDKKNGNDENEKVDEEERFTIPSWAIAAAATVAIVIFAVVRGSKR